MWEYKFVFKDDRVAGSFFDMLREMNNVAGFRCNLDTEARYEDIYYDTPDLALDRQGMTCRARRYEAADEYSLTLKREALGPNREAVFHKTDIATLSGDHFAPPHRADLPGEHRNVLRLFAGGKNLEPIINLTVFRAILNLANEQGIICSINLDRIEASLPGNPGRLVKEYEIELKSERPTFPEAERIRDFLRNAFNMIPITRSKARRLARIVRAGKPSRQPHKIILDMDTGVDDALAIILAMNSPELQVLGITTVSGNIDARQAARNSTAVLNMLQPEISARYPEPPAVAAGIMPDSPLPDASDVHGPDGLGGVSDKYLSSGPQTYPDAGELFQRLVNEYEPGSITLVTTGPLSNLARWIETAPEFVKKLKQIVSMGGVFFESGNRSQAAEFNIHADAAGARKVVEFCRTPLSPARYSWHETLPLTFVGLDVTHKASFRRNILEAAMQQAKTSETRVSFIREITRFYMDFYFRNEGLDGCYLHDPLAVAFLIDPSLLQVEQYHVEVEDRWHFTSGMTVADYRPTRLFKDKMKEVTWVAYKVDAPQFEKLFLDRVLRGIIEPEM